MPAEITRKSEFRISPIMIALAVVFAVGYVVGVNAFASGATPPSEPPCPQQTVQPR